MKITCLFAALGGIAAFQPRTTHFQRPMSHFTTTTSLSVSMSANMFAQTTMNDTALTGEASWLVDQRGMSSSSQAASTIVDKRGMSSTNRPTPVTSASTIVDQRGMSSSHAPTTTISTVSASTINQQVSSSSEASTSIEHQVVHSITSMDELLSVMNGQGATGHSSNNDNRLTMVKFYADYCKLCQRAGMQMKRLPQEFPSVDFSKIEQKVMTAPTAKTLRALGVTKFPFIQIYRGGKCVASFSSGPSHMFMKKVRDTLNLCLERDEQGWEDFHNEFQSEILENQEARQQLADALV